MVVINSVIMADFLMSETQHPVLVVILIIDSSYFLKFLVELEEYIVSRTATMAYKINNQPSWLRMYIVHVH